jgi:hypothetical protein
MPSFWTIVTLSLATFVSQLNWFDAMCLWPFSIGLSVLVNTAVFGFIQKQDIVLDNLQSQGNG